jgi:hypothetical protein
VSRVLALIEALLIDAPVGSTPCRMIDP